jgi:pimeloyl-ACP methyl ester carboxylesterase
MSLPEGSVRRDTAIARGLEALAHDDTGSVPIQFLWHGRPHIDPLDFDHVIASRAVLRRGWRRIWHEQPGIGSPLVLLRENEIDPRISALGEALPVTAVFEPSANGGTLSVYDSLQKNSDHARYRGEALARDYTAPLAYMLRRDDIMPEMRALLHAGRFLKKLGLYRLSPYDPDKIPVVLVHGLTSTSQVWANMVNDLGADPKLRDRYQFWTFSYPTGVPILYSAMRLRQELASMRAHCDPDHKNPNLDRIVLVGHSMGGILSRMMISHSNERLLDWTPRPLEELQLPLEVETMARDMMIFEPQPYIGRAIFIAAPHRGSHVASLKIVQRATSLIRVPREIKNAVLTALTLNPDLALVLVPDNLLGSLNSVGDLRPSSDFMMAMADQPIAPGTPYHSIIATGRREEGKALADTDDGLVAYPSAHLEGAESEITVAGPHKIFDHTETIAEVARILKLHR